MSDSLQCPACVFITIVSDPQMTFAEVVREANVWPTFVGAGHKDHCLIHQVSLMKKPAATENDSSVVRVVKRKTPSTKKKPLLMKRPAASAKAMSGHTRKRLRWDE